MRSFFWRTALGKRRTGLANGAQVRQTSHRFGKRRSGLANGTHILAYKSSIMILQILLVSGRNLEF